MVDPYTSPWRVGTCPEVDRGALRRVAWTRPHHGVVLWRGLDALAPLTRILSAAQALDDVPLGTWAAAYLHGAIDLDGVRVTGVPQDVVFCPGRSGARRRRRGLVPLRSALGDGDVMEVAGVLVTSPLRTAFDLGRTASSLEAAVADVDCLLRHTGTSVTALVEYAAGRPGWKGVPLLRSALPLLDPRSRSRPESRMRVIWCRDAGLPLPEVNVEVRALGSGRLLGLPDLLDLGSGLVGEYDGAQHREAAQHGADNVREEAFEDHGLVVVRAMWRDVLQRHRLADRLRRGHARARAQAARRWYVPPWQLRS